MTELWRLPVAASAVMTGPVFIELPRRSCELRLTVEGDDGTPVVEKLEIHKCTFMASCTEEMFNLAYGRLISIESRWLAEIRETGRKTQEIKEALKHLMITFDDGPCYEFICRSWGVSYEVSPI
jgi:hypothetical protein